jgi:DNA-binding XRE family transcriptional regulator
MSPRSEFVTLEQLEKSLNLDEAKVAAAKKKLEARYRAYQLAELRRSARLTQSELAERIGVGQTRVSSIELGELTHTEVGTLQAYVAALGGELEVSVRFGDKRVLLG